MQRFQEFLILQQVHAQLICIARFSILSAEFVLRSVCVVLQVLLVIAIVLRWTEDMRNVRHSQTLESSISSASQVLRDGTEKQVSTENVVVGDIVRLLPGRLVPGDVRIIQACSLSIGYAPNSAHTLHLC